MRVQRDFPAEIAERLETVPLTTLEELLGTEPDPDFVANTKEALRSPDVQEALQDAVRHYKAHHQGRSISNAHKA